MMRLDLAYFVTEQGKPN